MRFKIWITNETVVEDKDKQLYDIFSDTFKALGISGFKKTDMLGEPLGKIVGDNEDSNGMLKGKKAVSKNLSTGQIFDRLKRLNDPEISQNVEDTRKWLDTMDQKHSANADTTVGGLLSRLFGKKYNDFIGKDAPQKEEPKAKVPNQPPRENLTKPNAPAPDNQGSLVPPPAQPGPPMTGMMGEQPPMPAANQVAMPPKPAGAELGMF